MSRKEKFTLPASRLVVIGAACAMLSAAGTILAATTTPEILISIENMKFSTPAANGTSMVSVVSLWDDPQTRRSSALVKFTKGSVRSHVHTFDYQLAVIKGI